MIFSVSSLAAMGGAITALMTLRVAQLVVTPPRSRPDDVPIRDVDRHAHTVTLGRTADSATPGRYGLRFSRDSGHARLGEVTAETNGTVTRELLGVDFGELLADTRGRFGGWFFLTPRDLGVDHESVSLGRPSAGRGLGHPRRSGRTRHRDEEVGGACARARGDPLGDAALRRRVP